MEREAVKVSTRGYHRDAGSRIVLDEEIIGAATREDGEPPVKNTLYLEKNQSNGSISISIAPIELSGFGGNYRISVMFTEDDIAKLFWECFPQIRDVVSRLYGLKALAEAHKAAVDAEIKALDLSQFLEDTPEKADLNKDR